MYQVLKLKPKRERSVLLKHPWIFSGALASVPQARDGEVVEVQASDGNVLGYGFYSPQGQISCRMFHWGPASDHFLTSAYWQEKIKAALHLRKNLIPPRTNAYRLIHAEGDFMPGLIADVYGDTLVMQWLVTGVEMQSAAIIEAFIQEGFRNIYLKTKLSSQNIERITSESRWIAGSSSMPLTIEEHGLSFIVDVEHGQKTGFFIDQRNNRKYLQSFSDGKHVLNMFCYTGGFSVYAAAGGAKSVCSVDISKNAIDMAHQNMIKNNFGHLHTAIEEDCFDYLKHVDTGIYDIIILDPPAFAKNARSVDNASRGYKQINMKAIEKVKAGGFIFTFSCSQNISKELFQKIVFAAAADAGRNVRILYQLHQSPDHPINIYHPEGEYLKGFILHVE
ncbi:MAG: class I SAM-dependent rRNA methyltransferase [Cytophagaceae bacterium]|nr:class I SAM-dependent rRNA methyltransferase [Cytophagaceae bacterium]MDW8457396.1 class I SAM-dependent rRNA methyltransferase [Cytophagaceae bacterium]